MDTSLMLATSSLISTNHRYNSPHLCCVENCSQSSGDTAAQEANHLKRSLLINLSHTLLVHDSVLRKCGCAHLRKGSNPGQSMSRLAQLHRNPPSCAAPHSDLDDLCEQHVRLTVCMTRVFMHCCDCQRRCTIHRKSPLTARIVLAIRDWVQA